MEKEREKRIAPSSPQEHAMIAAFALAIVGIAILGSLEIAAHAH